MNKSTSSGIYFYVQRFGNKLLPAAKDGVIRFNKERLNIGGAMNISTGVFTVPKAGIYHFSASVAKEGYSIDAIHSLKIYFRVNGNKIGMSGIGGTVAGAPVNIPPTLKLKKGDRVDLWKENNNGILEYRTGELAHHFTGWLLAEEDLL